MTSPDSHNAISSRGSAVGLTRYKSLASQMTLPFGPPVYPANPGAQQAEATDCTTTDTSGLSSESLSTHAIPELSSVNKLPAKKVNSGSADFQTRLTANLKRTVGRSHTPEYVVTWKQWDMRSGVPICALRARGRTAKAGLCVAIRVTGNQSQLEPRTSDNACSGWPTPNAHRHGTCKPELVLKRMSGPKRQINLEDIASLTGYPTPNTMPDALNGMHGSRGRATTGSEHESMLGGDCGLSSGVSDATNRHGRAGIASEQTSKGLWRR